MELLILPEFAERKAQIPLNKLFEKDLMFAPSFFILKRAFVKKRCSGF